MSASRTTSPWLHAGFLALVIFGCFTAAAPWLNRHGFLFAGAGLLMMIFRPVATVPRGWWWLILGFCLAAATAFLPADGLGIPEWRRDLENLGLDTGDLQTAQPRLAVEYLGVFAITLFTGMWLAGQRASKEDLTRLALAFALGVAGYAGFSIVKANGAPAPGVPEVFGFFPNRNHTATLLAMGAVTGLACVAQSIRDQRWWGLGLGLLATVVCLWAALVSSESRAGLLLVGGGGITWWLMMGRSYLGPHAWKAVLLLAVAVVGGFLIADTKIKERIEGSTERLSDAKAGAESVGAANDGAAGQLARLDFRIPIWADTLNLIAAQPWSGTGGGSFAAVAPQFRRQTVTANDSEGAHPESDWLWLAAEMGVPAALCLAILVAWASLHGLRQARWQRARALRTGCLIAGLLVAVHGIFDVPGHRIPLAWAAALLFSLGLPAPESGESRRPSGWPFRLVGAVIFLAGCWLMNSVGEPSKTPAIALGEVTRSEVQRLYREDLALQKERQLAGMEEPLAGAEDRLEVALGQIDFALQSLPLDRGLWYWKGFLALHYDDKMDEAKRAFVIERALDPDWVGGPLRQARAWLPVDHGESLALWTEALQRADRLDAGRKSLLPTWRDRALAQIVRDAGRDPALKAQVERLGKRSGER